MTANYDRLTGLFAAVGGAVGCWAVVYISPVVPGVYVSVVGGAAMALGAAAFALMGSALIPKNEKPRQEVEKLEAEASDAEIACGGLRDRLEMAVVVNPNAGKTLIETLDKYLAQRPAPPMQPPLISPGLALEWRKLEARRRIREAWGYKEALEERLRKMGVPAPIAEIEAPKDPAVNPSVGSRVPGKV